MSETKKKGFEVIIKTQYAKIEKIVGSEKEAVDFVNEVLKDRKSTFHSIRNLDYPNVVEMPASNKLQ